MKSPRSLATPERPDQLEELWALVDEFGDLAVRLRKAADAAMEILNRGEQGEGT